MSDCSINVTVLIKPKFYKPTVSMKQYIEVTISMSVIPLYMRDVITVVVIVN